MNKLLDQGHNNRGELKIQVVWESPPMQHRTITSAAGMVRSHRTAAARFWQPPKSPAGKIRRACTDT